MNSRERFLEVMRFGKPDRIPYFEEGIRKEVLSHWRKHGLGVRADLKKMFQTDRREELELDVDPHPQMTKWPRCLADLDGFRQRLNSYDEHRLTKDFNVHSKTGKSRDYVLLLRVHRGFFLSMGVRDWNRFSEVIYLLNDEPRLVRESMCIQGEFAARLVERALGALQVDAAVFSEPIGGNDRALMSPRMYEDFVLKSYEPILDVLKQHGVETIVFRTYANARALLPSIMKWGFNCLWACETNVEAMDYVDIRREFGRELRLIGGIDLDSLRRGKDAINREVEGKVPLLVAEGGYIPLADGRVREDVTFENYFYYRQLLEKVTQAAMPNVL